MKVGDKIFKEYKNKLRSYTITKIGNKWLFFRPDEYIDNPYFEEKVDKNTLNYIDKNYTQRNFKVYLSIKSYNEENEEKRLRLEVSQFFSLRGNLTIDQVKNIHKIIYP